MTLEELHRTVVDGLRTADDRFAQVDARFVHVEAEFGNVRQEMRNSVPNYWHGSKRMARRRAAIST